MATDDTRDDVGGGATVTTFDDLEQLAAPPAPNLDPSSVKLEGDSIPEPLRGKSLSDVIALQAEQVRALEAARGQIDSLRALAEARQVQPASPQPPAVPQPEPELTAQQLRELYDKDPFEYNQYVLTNMEKKLLRTVDTRVAPMSHTTASVAESQARQKFSEEFAVLGQEINQVLSQIPDRSVLAQPGSWDQIMYYVRGQHMDKLLEARRVKSDAAALEEARKREANGAGTVGRRGGGSASAVRARITDLTPEQKRASEVLGITEDQYRQYYF